jgi:hypothetical protein
LRPFDSGRIASPHKISNGRVEQSQLRKPKKWRKT